MSPEEHGCRVDPASAPAELVMAPQLQSDTLSSQELPRVIDTLCRNEHRHVCMRPIRSRREAECSVTPQLQSDAPSYQKLMTETDSECPKQQRLVPLWQSYLPYSHLVKPMAASHHPKKRRQGRMAQGSPSNRLDTILEDQVFPPPSRDVFLKVVRRLCIYSDPIVASILLNIGIMLVKCEDKHDQQSLSLTCSWIVVPLTVLTCLCLGTRDEVAGDSPKSAACCKDGHKEHCCKVRDYARSRTRRPVSPSLGLPRSRLPTSPTSGTSLQTLTPPNERLMPDSVTLSSILAGGIGSTCRS